MSRNSRKPPVAARKTHSFSVHGVNLEDPYAWLQDPNYPKVDDPEILAYLEAENDYFEQTMAPLQPLIDELYAEIKGRQQPDETSVPFRDGDFSYQWRFAEGAQYRTWWRWPGSGREKSSEKSGKERAEDQAELILDEPGLAGNSEYFRLGGWSVSPNGRYLAYSTDRDGSERFVLQVRDLETSQLLADVIEDTLGAPTWAADSATFFYPVLDDHWRPHQIKSHQLGADPGTDPLIYQEPGDFFVSVGKTQSRAFIIIAAGDHMTSEVRFLPADQPEGTPTLIAPRRSGHEYEVEHHDRHFYVHSNDQHKNFRLARTPIDTPEESYWEPVIDGDDRHYLMGVTCFAQLMVIEERIDGLDQLRLRDYHGGERYVAFPETTYHAQLGVNPEFQVEALRIDYQSMITPHTVYDYQLGQDTVGGDRVGGDRVGGDKVGGDKVAGDRVGDAEPLTVLKVQVIPSGYDPAAYRCERLMAPSRDGREIPVSIVLPSGFETGQARPLYLYGYGAYGHAVPPGFSTSRLSLLDRGFGYAIAHVRGGDDLGYGWYEDGKLNQRSNTFNDFVDVARFLINAGYTAPGRLAIAGASAGGELVGAALNQAPELWGAVVAHVPFVDVLNTMLNADLPLTPMEWPEWGNPIEDEAAFHTILDYSPYDQLVPGRYPPMLVTAGLNDPRVTYWEPAKYVAKLRTLKSDDQTLLLKTNMGAGHGGKSGRFDALHEVAEEYAFVLNALDTN